MQVREYSEADLSELKKLHTKSGFRYDLPDLRGQEFFSKRIVGDEHGIAMAGFLRLTAEALLICDPTWRNAPWRELALRQLHHVCRKDAFDKGVWDVNAFLPPEIEQKFSQRLLKMGWKRYLGDEWKCYSYEVGQP